VLGSSCQWNNSVDSFISALGGRGLYLQHEALVGTDTHSIYVDTYLKPAQVKINIQPVTQRPDSLVLFYLIEAVSEILGYTINKIKILIFMDRYVLCVRG